MRIRKRVKNKEYEELKTPNYSKVELNNRGVENERGKCCFIVRRSWVDQENGHIHVDIHMRKA
jgi:hypothetical protein